MRVFFAFIKCSFFLRYVLFSRRLGIILFWFFSRVQCGCRSRKTCIEENSTTDRTREKESNNRKIRIAALIHCFCLLASAASFLCLSLEQFHRNKNSIEKEVNQNQVGKYTIVVAMFTWWFFLRFARNSSSLSLCTFSIRFTLAHYSTTWRWHLFYVLAAKCSCCFTLSEAFILFRYSKRFVFLCHLCILFTFDTWMNVRSDGLFCFVLLHRGLCLHGRR